MPVTVIGTNAAVNLICQAAVQGLSLLARYGLASPKRLTIQVVDANPRLPEGVTGCYDRGTETISMLSLSGCRRHLVKRRPFGEEFSEDLFASFVAHEVGHAVAAANFMVARPSRLAHECIAYIVQFGAMSPALRRRILGHFRHVKAGSLADLTPALWLFRAEEFAVRCYKLHARSAETGAFLKKLLSGKLPAQLPDVPL